MSGVLYKWTVVCYTSGLWYEWCAIQVDCGVLYKWTVVCYTSGLWCAVQVDWCEWCAIQVDCGVLYKWTVQNCTEVLERLRDGSFGSCDKMAADYQAQCHNLFPHAHIFLPASEKVKASTEGVVLTNGSLS